MPLDNHESDVLDLFHPYAIRLDRLSPESRKIVTCSRSNTVED
jgi:hypothetical protein